MKHNARLEIRLPLVEKHRIEHAAEEAGISVSDYMREKAVPTTPTVPEQAAVFLGDQDLEKLIRRKQARGLTRPVAEREARREMTTKGS